MTNHSDMEHKTIEVDELPALFDTIEALMQRVEQITEQATNDHLAAFAAQMREKFGADAIALDEPYLPELRAFLSLRFLVKLEQLMQKLEQGAGNDRFRTTIFNLNEPIVPQLQNRLQLETVRHQLEAKQELDKTRQQQFGVKKYIWRTAGDDKVRPSHAANDGKIFEWDNPPPTGNPGDAPGCRCIAEPAPDDAGDPTTVAIAVLLVRIAIALASLRKRAIATVIGQEILDELDENGQRVVRERLEEIERERLAGLFKRPENVPEDWVKRPTKKGDGVIYEQPGSKGATYIKIQKGNPNSSNPGQRVDNVRWTKDGKSLDKNGNVVPRSSRESHIPFEEFKFRSEFFR
ncbi:MAG: phage minor head protein [Rickettsiales bacterium]